MAALLQFVQIIFYLLGMQLCRQALKVQCHGGHMAAVVVKGAGRAAKDADVALKALQQLAKTCNLTAGPVQVLVVTKFFRRFFLVTIM